MYRVANFVFRMSDPGAHQIFSLCFGTRFSSAAAAAASEALFVAPSCRNNGWCEHNPLAYTSNPLQAPEQRYPPGGVNIARLWWVKTLIMFRSSIVCIDAWSTPNDYGKLQLSTPPPPAPAPFPQCVPFSMRTMWVHAYQSLVWNSLACARLRLLGPEAVPGDLVLLPDQKTPPDVGAGDASASTCSSSSGGTGDIAAAPRLIPVVVNNRSSSAAGGGVPRQGATGAPGGAAAEGGRTMSTSGAAVVVNGRRREAVGVLTSEMMEAFASEGITPRELLLRRVVLPLAGTSILYPLHEVRFPSLLRATLARERETQRKWNDFFCLV